MVLQVGAIFVAGLCIRIRAAFAQYSEARLVTICVCVLFTSSHAQAPFDIAEGYNFQSCVCMLLVHACAFEFCLILPQAVYPQSKACCASQVYNILLSLILFGALLYGLRGFYQLCKYNFSQIYTSFVASFFNDHNLFRFTHSIHHVVTGCHSNVNYHICGVVLSILLLPGV